MKYFLSFLLIFTTTLFAQQNARQSQHSTERNIMKNPGFENGKAGWTPSGAAGDFTLTAVNGDTHGNWDATAASQTFCSEYFPTGKLGGRTCSLVLGHSWDGGSGGDINVVVQQDNGGANDDLFTPVNLAVTSNSLWHETPLQFTCPAADNIRVCYNSTADAASIKLDDHHLGTVTNKSSARMSPETVFHGYVPTTTNCNWTRTNVSKGPFPTDADCPAITVDKVSGSVSFDTTNTQLPHLPFLNLPPDDYELTVIVSARGSTGLFQLGIDDGSGSNTKSQLSSNAASTSRHPFTMVATFNHAGGAKTFRILGGASAGGDIILNNSESEERITWTLRKESENNVDTVNLNTQGSLFKGYHQNDCTWVNGLGATLDDFDGDATCTFTETTNTFGTVISHTDGTGPMPGIVATSNFAGWFKVCATTHVGTTVANGAATLQIDTDGTIEDETAYRGVSDVGDNVPARLCAVSFFSSATVSKTIQFRGSSSAGNIQLGALGADTTRHVVWQIFPVIKNNPQAVAISNAPTNGCVNGETHCSGSYTPALTSFVNLDSLSVAGEAQFEVTGDRVSVDMQLNTDCTTGSITLTSFEVALPIASDLTASNPIRGGVGIIDQTSGPLVGIFCAAEITNETADCLYFCTENTAHSAQLNFSYKIQ